MNRLLVTGGAGYIGSHTVLKLLENDFDIIVLDNLSNSSKESLNRVSKLTKKDIPFVKCDIRDYEALAEVFRKNVITAVIHFAGLKSVSASVSNPLEYYQNNVYGSLQLFRAMGNFDVKNIVFSSSATVYGDPDKLPLDESMPAGKPTNPYGMSKLMIENILDDIYRSDKSWNIVKLRYFNPVGAHHSGEIGEDPLGIPNNLMPYICQTATGEREELKVFGSDYDTLDGSGVRDFIHVCDLAEGHICALERCYKNNGNDVYNLGTGKGTSVIELIKTFEKVNKVKLNYKITERRDGDVASCFADVKKIKSELGWFAKRDINDMCKDAWRWQSLNPKGYRT